MDLTDVLELMEPGFFVDNKSNSPNTKIIKGTTSENPQNREHLSTDASWKITGGSALVLLSICAHAFAFWGPRDSKTLVALVVMEEVRAECKEQREKMNGGAIRVAYACNTEMKLTRHLSVHMADSRPNDPVTLHSRAKC